MSAAAWNTAGRHSLGLLLLGHCSQIDEQGACIIGDNLLILMNAYHKAVPFTMPKAVQKFPRLDRLFDTFHGDAEIVPYETAKPYPLQPRSVALFRHKPGT